jgi:hypothetical protein
MRCNFLKFILLGSKMLTTYFLGGVLKWQNCGTKIEAVRSIDAELPKGVEYVISMDTELKVSPEEARKHFTEKGWPKCKVSDSGTIMWYSKTSKPCKKFTCPDLSSIKKNSTAIVGVKQSFEKFLKHGLNKSPGSVRIESTEPIEFEDAEISTSGKDRIYPSLAISKLLKRTKAGEVKFRGNLIVDTDKPTNKSLMDLLGQIPEFRQTICNIYPLIKSMKSWTVSTKDATVTCTVKPALQLDWFPTYSEKPMEETVSLVLGCITDIVGVLEK